MSNYIATLDMPERVKAQESRAQQVLPGPATGTKMCQSGGFCPYAPFILAREHIAFVLYSQGRSQPVRRESPLYHHGMIWGHLKAQTSLFSAVGIYVGKVEVDVDSTVQSVLTYILCSVNFASFK